MPRYFIALNLTAVAFVWVTCAALPPVVASHFGMNGAANGSMSRSAYCLFMVAFVVGLPCLVALSGRFAGLLPVQMINLPHRDVWLAPERRSATILALSQRLEQLASALIMYLCFMHWLVVRANATQPPRLDLLPFFAGMGLFLLGLTVWILALYARFGRVP